ncbi:MAG: DUF4160 domain-containing protein [Vicinamibacteria bacterium]
MPSLLQVEGFRFFFYSSEGNEPAHVHVERAEAEAKFWLDPLRLFPPHDAKGTAPRAGTRLPAPGPLQGAMA